MAVLLGHAESVPLLLPGPPLLLHPLHPVQHHPLSLLLPELSLSTQQRSPLSLLARWLHPFVVLLVVHLSQDALDVPRVVAYPRQTFSSLLLQLEDVTLLVLRHLLYLNYILRCNCILFTMSSFIYIYLVVSISIIVKCNPRRDNWNCSKRCSVLLHVPPSPASRRPKGNCRTCTGFPRSSSCCTSSPS